MTTPLQRIANRANAAKSTGPKSSDGKQITRANALTHGLTAQTMLLEGEDEHVFELFHQALADELSPVGAMEAELADRLISLMWRSRRIAGFEAAILEWMGHWARERYDGDGSQRGTSQQSERVQMFHNGLNPHDGTLSAERRKHLTVGRLLHEGMNHNLMAKLSRYEAHLLGQLRRTHAEFQAQQARRVGAPAETLRRLNAMLELDAKNRMDTPDANPARGPTVWT